MKKKLCSLILSLCLIVALVPAMSLTAYAAIPAGAEFSVDGVVLIDGGVRTANDVDGITVDENGDITLQDYNGGYIYAGGAGYRPTITLVGENKITAKDTHGVRLSSGGTIKGSGGLYIDVQRKRLGNANGIAVNFGDLTITDGASVFIDVQAEMSEASGLYTGYSGDITISNGAEIYINVQTPGEVCGIRPAGKVNITGGYVAAKAHSTAEKAYGIYAGGDMTVSGGECYLSATSDSTGSNVAYGIYTNGTYTQSAGTVFTAAEATAGHGGVGLDSLGELNQTGGKLFANGKAYGNGGRGIRSNGNITLSGGMAAGKGTGGSGSRNGITAYNTDLTIAKAASVLAFGDGASLYWGEGSLSQNTDNAETKRWTGDALDALTPLGEGAGFPKDMYNTDHKIGVSVPSATVVDDTLLTPLHKTDFIHELVDYLIKSAEITVDYSKYDDALAVEFYNALLDTIGVTRANTADNDDVDDAFAALRAAYKALTKKDEGEKAVVKTTGNAPKISDTRYWDGIVSEIKNAKDGAEIDVNMTHYTSMPKVALTELKGKNITLEIKAGNELFSLNGKDIGEITNSKYSFAELIKAFGKTESGKDNPGTGGGIVAFGVYAALQAR